MPGNCRPEARDSEPLLAVIERGDTATSKSFVELSGAYRVMRTSSNGSSNDRIWASQALKSVESRFERLNCIFCSNAGRLESGEVERRICRASEGLAACHRDSRGVSSSIANKELRSTASCSGCEV